MNRKSLPALVALNVVLLIALVLVTLMPAPAAAQLGGTRAAYVMIAGAAKAETQRNVVYLIELNSSRMIALTFNSANDRLEVIAARTLTDDVNADLGGRGGRRDR